MSSETIVIDYSEMISLPQMQVTRKHGFNSRPVVSSYDEHILPLVKMKKLDKDLYRSVTFKKTKLIKQYEQDKYKIRSLEF